jgi:hypothetical protein
MSNYLYRMFLANVRLIELLVARNRGTYDEEISRLVEMNREIMRSLLQPATYEFTIPLSSLESALGTSLDTSLESVIVRPTEEQLVAASRRATFRDITRPKNTSCPISLEPFQDGDEVVMIRHCGHIFSPVEFDTWFQSNCRCPVCRYDVRELL